MHLSSLRRFLSGLLILTTALLAGRAALAAAFHARAFAGDG